MDNIAQGKTTYNVVWEAPENIASKNYVQNCINTLGRVLYRKMAICNIVQEALDNFSEETVLFKIALIFLEENCTGKNPLQYCPRGSVA